MSEEGQVLRSEEEDILERLVGSLQKRVFDLSAAKFLEVLFS